MTAEAILRLVNDPVLPFYPLDIALDVQNKLKGNISSDGGGRQLPVKSVFPNEIFIIGQPLKITHRGTSKNY